MPANTSKPPVKPFPTIRKNNIYEDVIGHLKAHIIDNGLGPGDRLPTEAVLAESFGVSRLSVREALKVLESLGVVQSKTRDGTRLRELSMKPAADHLRFLLDVEQVSVQEVTVARQLIECAMMPVIVANAGPEEFARIAAANDEMQAAVDAGDELGAHDADYRFHEALLAATRNRAIEGFGVMLQEFFQNMRRHAHANKSAKPSVTEHRAIYEALRAGDADGATEIMRYHLRVYGTVPGTRPVAPVKIKTETAAPGNAAQTDCRAASKAAPKGPAPKDPMAKRVAVQRPAAQRPAAKIAANPEGSLKTNSASADATKRGEL